MNWKKYALAVAAVFIIGRMMVSFLFFGLLFASTFDQVLPGARPEGKELHGPYMIATLIWSLAFVHLFGRWAANGGVMEGLRFGSIVWALYFLPMVVCYWAYFDLPVDWMTAGLVSGLGESIVSGALAAVIYRRKMTNAPS
jgi:hypothetical protein